MSKIYTLTPDYYLYAYTDQFVEAFKKASTPETKLAMDKKMAIFSNNEATLLNPGDKLTIHGTEIDETLWPELCKSFYYTGTTTIFHPSRSTGFTICSFGVNSEGDCILVLPYTVSYEPKERTTFKLPFKFDWARFGVIVPNSINDHLRKMEDKLQGKIEQVSELEQQMQKAKMMGKIVDEIKELKQQPAKLEQNQQEKLQEKDKMMGKKEGKIKALKQQVKIQEHKLQKTQTNLGKAGGRVGELKQQVVSLEQQLQEKDKWVQGLVAQLIGSRVGSVHSSSPTQQEEFDQKLNHKLDQVLSDLHTIKHSAEILKEMLIT